MINTAEKLVDSKWNCLEFNMTTIEDSKEIFEELKSNGIIKETSYFDDMVWIATDEYRNIGFHFDFNRFGYKWYEGIFKMPLTEFVTYVKVYMLSLFGQNVLSTINEFLLDMRKIISNEPQTVIYGYETLSITSPNHCSDFLQKLSERNDYSEELEDLIDSMNCYTDMNIAKQSTKKRPLAQMDSYFEFNDIINDYWKSCITEEEKLFYYPLYLWWKITGVIPLRPREFLLTKRDCLKFEDGNYSLSLRRNRIKGSGRSISYKIAGDYVDDVIKIPMNLGMEIEEYLQLTANQADTEINTLFVTDPHYKRWLRKTGRRNRYLTYANMTTILHTFYEEIICGRYGYTILPKEDNASPDKKEINIIHLGDTRHLALFNLIEEGIPISTAMLLAGHADMETSSHYFSNVHSFIECKVYRQHRKMLAGKEGYQISKTAYFPSCKESINLSSGKCYSENFINGRIDDCLKAKGINGEIAYCPDCIYYRKDGHSYYSNDDIYKKHINDDYTALRKAVEAVRRQRGDVEDIGEVLLRLNASSASYEKYLQEKLKKEGDKNYGKKENY